MRLLWPEINECHVYRIGSNAIFVHDCNVTVLQNGDPINYEINEIEANSESYIYATPTYNSDLKGNELRDIDDGIYHLWVRYEYDITPKITYLDVVGLPITAFGKLYFWESQLESIKYVFGKAVSDLEETASAPIYFDVERNRQTSYRVICKITVSGTNIEITDFYRNSIIEPHFNLYFGRGQYD